MMTPNDLWPGVRSRYGAFSFKILGPLEIGHEDRLVPVCGVREQAVLAVLLLEAGHVVPLARLVEAVWDADPPQAAEKAVRNTVSALRGRLAHAGGSRALIETSTAGYRLRPDRSQLDAARFADHAASARHLAGTGRAGEAVSELRAALGLWRGPALAGLGGLLIEAAAARLDEQRLTAWEDCLDLELRLGRHREVTDELQVLVSEHPLRETLAGQLMLALYRAGRQAEALDAYHRLAKQLVDDLGLDASGEITRLHEAILRHDPTLDLKGEPQRGTPRELPSAVPGFPGRPFVGREAEFAVARQALEALPQGVGGIQLVAGEPGIGKSRFAAEVAAEAEAMGVQALQVQCPPVAGRPAYWPWSELLRQLLSGAERTSWALPGADVLAQIERPTVQQSIVARTRFFQEVRTRLEEAAGSAGLLVVLDDLHWADEPSLELLRYLAAAVSASPLLFLVTYRPDDVDHGHSMRRVLPLLARQPGISRIVLQGLGAADVQRYARVVLGPAFDHRRGESLYLRTRGHPFFVTELVEMMQGEERERVPESIREMLNESLDRVSERALGTLRAGAVIGQEFGLAILQAVTNQRAEDLVSDLAAAIDRRLMVRTTQPPGRFAFRHPLIREVLYEGMPALDRIRLHRRAAEALEQLQGPTLDEHLGELARHWVEAATPGALVRGADYARRAAESAMSRLGYEEAARLYELALGADPPYAERCRLLLGEATARFRLGEIRRSIAICKQAADTARQIGRPDLLAEAALVVHHIGDRDANTFLADLCEEVLAALAPGMTSLRVRLTAQRSVALSRLARRTASDLRAMAAEAMDLADEDDDPEGVFSALDARQQLLAGVAGDEERVDLGERAVTLAATSGRRSYALSGHLWRIDAWLKLGQTRHADADLREVVSIGATLRQPLVDWHVLTIRATLAELAGRLADAEWLIQQAHATGCPAEDGGIDCYFYGFMSGLGKLRGEFAEWEARLWEFVRERPAEPPFAEAFIATTYIDLGREAEARVIYEQTIARLDALTPDTVPLSLLAYLSELACAFDDKDRAALLYRALLPYGGCHLIPGYGTFACEGTVSRFLGMLAACQGQLDSAEVHHRQAIDDNGQAGALPFVAMSQFEYARLLRRRGRTRDVRAAAERARQAKESAVAMGMRPLLKRTEAFIRELDADPPAVLTPREAEISRLVADGLANREVARQLGISVRTVESHVDHILTKLGLSSRAQLRPNP